jgi:hypothetical protein
VSVTRLAKQAKRSPSISFAIIILREARGGFGPHQLGDTDMTINKNYKDRTISFECDTCGDEYEADGLNFYDAYDDYKQNGGIARLVGGDWEHTCENCK